MALVAGRQRCSVVRGEALMQTWCRRDWQVTAAPVPWLDLLRGVLSCFPWHFFNICAFIPYYLSLHHSGGTWQRFPPLKPYGRR